MKIKGSELTLWMNTAWPGDDWIWDHDLFDDPEPDATYDTDEIGELIWQGNRDDDPTHGNGLDLASLIRKWRKDRNFDILTFRVPKVVSDDLIALAKKMGAKVEGNPK